MAVSNAGSALGQLVGKLFEGSLVQTLRPSVEERNHKINPERLVNGADNVYQIDAVIRDEQDQPVILLDPKYIRYKKHNRDKGSWLCTSHYALRKTYPSLRKSIAVLAGNWSSPSIKLMESFGVEVLQVPFEHMVSVLGDYGVQFDWDERDRVTPMHSLEAFTALHMDIHNDIAGRLVEPVRNAIIVSVNDVIESDWSTSASRVTSVEVLLKTDRNEMLMRQYDSVAAAMQGMIPFVSDLSDVREFLQDR